MQLCAFGLSLIPSILHQLCLNLPTTKCLENIDNKLFFSSSTITKTHHFPNVQFIRNQKLQKNLTKKIPKNAQLTAKKIIHKKKLPKSNSQETLSTSYV